MLRAKVQHSNENMLWPAHQTLGCLYCTSRCQCTHSCGGPQFACVIGIRLLQEAKQVRAQLAQQEAAAGELQRAKQAAEAAAAAMKAQLVNAQERVAASERQAAKVQKYAEDKEQYRKQLNEVTPSVPFCLHARAGVWVGGRAGIRA